MASVWDQIKRAFTGSLFGGNFEDPRNNFGSAYSAPGPPRLTQTSANVPVGSVLNVAGNRYPRNSNPVMMGGTSYGGLGQSLSSAQPTAPSGNDYLQSVLAQYLAAAEMPSEGALRSQLSSAAHAEFDPQIAALQAAMGQAKQRHKGAAKNVGGIYRDLKKYYERSGVESAKRGKAQKQEAADRFAQLQATINQQYSGSMDEQLARLQELGIAEAAGGPQGVLQQQSADQANAAAIARLIGASEESALNQMAASDTNYWLEGAGITQQQGSEALAGLQGQLMDYLNKTGTDIAGLTGQREASVAKGVSSAMGQAQDRRLEALKNAVGMGIDIRKMEQAGLGTEGLTGAAGVLGADPSATATFIDLLSRAEDWKNSAAAKNQYGKYTIGTGKSNRGKQVFSGSTTYTPGEMANIIRNGALNLVKEGKLSPDQVDKMWKAAQAYYGKL